MNAKKHVVTIITITIIVGALLLLLSYMLPKSGGADLSGSTTASTVDKADIAKFLTSKNVIFYGAFWCSHCAEQKAKFGSAKKYLPYVECSTPDQRNQTNICIKEKIVSYPTWKVPKEGVLYRCGLLEPEVLANAVGYPVRKLDAPTETGIELFNKVIKTPTLEAIEKAKKDGTYKAHQAEYDSALADVTDSWKKGLAKVNSSISRMTYAEYLEVRFNSVCKTEQAALADIAKDEAKAAAAEAKK